VIKLVADRGRGVLVGATVMGPSGGEVIGLLALAVHAEVPVDHLRRMIYTYPTFHRGWRTPCATSVDEAGGATAPAPRSAL
jgi:pyruvate/2-oxoglutarate dehydrogenase complex dihydrolipoamide dehydrogenase (E3) component